MHLVDKGGNLQHDHATKKMYIVLCPVYFSVSTYWLSIFLDFKEWKKATAIIINLEGGGL